MARSHHAVWRTAALAAAAAAAAAPAASAAAPLLSLAPGANGTYTIGVAGATWFQAPPLAFSVGGVVYTPGHGLTQVGAAAEWAGADGIGAFAAVNVTWAAGAPGGPVRVVTTFLTYASGAALGFITTFPDGVPSQAKTPPAGTGGLAVGFPALAPGPGWPGAGSLWQDPGSGNCGFTVYGAKSFPAPSDALLVLSPPVPPSSPAAARVAVGLASVTQQPVVRQAAAGGALVAGPGAEFDLPPGWSAMYVLVAVGGGVGPASPTRADWGLPVGGPSDAVFALGDALLAYHGKPRPRPNFDRIHATLGYSGTIQYFYNPCGCGRFPNNTCPPDAGGVPGRLPNCATYADSFLAAAADLTARRIPFGHILIDSYWYGEGVYGGVSEWEDDPALMAAVHSFPASLRAFSAALPGVDLWAHNGRWVSSSPYLSRFPFAPGTTMPQGRQLWDHVFPANAAGWRLRTIKQDHVAEQIAAAGTITNASQIAAWLGGMGAAAADAGVSIQMCCSQPMVLHNTVNIAAATGARSSPDYVASASGRVLNLPLVNWANGVDSGFHFALGLVPDKDGFYSNSTPQQTGEMVLPPAYWPSFANYSEANPVKHAAMAALCGGPVHVGDGVGAVNATLAWALMRGDGVVLRTSRPHAAVDAELLAMMFGGWVTTAGVGEEAAAAAVAPAAPPSPRSSYSTLPNNGLGEVYSSVTLIPAAAAGGGGGGGGPCTRWTIVTAAQVSKPYNLTAGDVGLDAATLAAATCVANGGAWVAVAWDTSAFAPAAAPAPRTVFDGSAAGAAIPLVADSDGGYAAPLVMTVIAPVVGGWVVAGEVGKIVPASPQRLAFVAPAGGGVSVGLVGGAGETVFVAACPAGGTGCEAPLATYSCTLPASGNATLALPGGTCG
jgi:hypothetical protein